MKNMTYPKVDIDHNLLLQNVNQFIRLTKKSDKGKR